MDETPMLETRDTSDPQKTTAQKLDALSTSVDKRFNAVDEALVGQRQYTEFAFDKLATEMKDGFDKVNGRFDKVNGRFDKVDGRFNRLERKLDQFIDTQAKANELVERRLQALEPPKPLNR